jgi:agmatine deiminase
MPAEWEPQESVWLSWPTNTQTWPPSLLEPVRETYRALIRALSPDQIVNVLVDDDGSADRVRTELAGESAGLSGVRFHVLPTVDTWIRDYGPTFVKNDRTRRIAMVDWRFNAWGDKYADLKADDAVPAAINSGLDLDVFDPGIVMEGGAIEVNGRGTLLTTEQCLLNPNRNPQMNAARIEAVLGEYLGVWNVLWLGEGIVGDDTDGHVDDIARFVGPRTVLAAFEDDPSDQNYPILKDNFERLSRATDERGNRLEVRTLPMPDPVIGPDGRLPASYANFYIGNGAVAVPVFGHSEKDRTALEVVGSLFPGRRVVGIDCTAMVHGLGAIHCGCQQQPGF